jgi:hypothetical protein
VGRQERYRACVLAGRGQVHPDPEVAAAASAWSRSGRPAWRPAVLTAVAVGALAALAVGIAVHDLVLLVVGAVGLVAAGLTAQEAAVASRLRRLPATPTGPG